MFTVTEAAALRGRLPDALGVTPGSVTPFAFANDAAGRLSSVLDRGMLDCNPLNYHRRENNRTTAVAPADLLRFIAAWGCRPRRVDLAGLPAA